MSAAEVIEQIKALPREEQREVFEFVRDAERAGSVRYATDEEARAAGDAIVAEFPETFRRLAE